MADNDKIAVGRREGDLLDAITRLDTPGVRLDDARRLFPDWPTQGVHLALKRLARKGRLRRLAPGRYYLADVDPARAAGHAWAPAYESFLTILAQSGATEQIPRRLDLAYAHGRLRRADWAGLPITWHPIPPDAFTGYTARPDGALVATPPKAAADLVHRQADFGGVRPYRAMVAHTLRHAKPRELGEALTAYEPQPGTLRRLLHLTWGDALPPAWRRRVQRLDLHNPLPLDLLRRPARPRGAGPLNIDDPEAA